MTSNDDVQDMLSLMAIPRDSLGEGTGLTIRVGGDSESLASLMAEEMAELIRRSMLQAREVCAVVPVGPVGQYEHLLGIIENERLDCSRVTFINMDEFLDKEDRFIDSSHPLSFRGFMDGAFYERLPLSARFPRENRVFPDPQDLAGVGEVIRDRGGVDVYWGGIGLNGHLAFNEPEETGVEAFGDLSTRIVEIAPESRAHMAVNLSCVPGIIPKRAVTVGMREILGSRRISIYANRPWQSGVVRLLLRGPVGPACPASYLRTHPDARLTLADYVAEPCRVRLR